MIEQHDSSGSYSAATYEELAVDLESAIQWIEGLEIAVAGTRVGRYRLLLAEVLELQTSGNVSQASSGYRQYVNALFALHELSQVYRAFADREHTDFVRHRMRTVTSGPIAYPDEVPASGSNLARNIEF